jgi:hypothetical protein
MLIVIIIVIAIVIVIVIVIIIVIVIVIIIAAAAADDELFDSESIHFLASRRLSLTADCTTRYSWHHLPPFMCF